MLTSAFLSPLSFINLVLSDRHWLSIKIAPQLDARQVEKRRRDVSVSCNEVHHLARLDPRSTNVERYVDVLLKCTSFAWLEPVLTNVESVV